MLNLMGRSETRSKGERERNDVREVESNEEFDFGTTEEVGTFGTAEEAEYALDKRTNGRRSTKYGLARCKGSGQRNKLELEPTERGGGKT